MDAGHEHDDVVNDDIAYYPWYNPPQDGHWLRCSPSRWGVGLLIEAFTSIA